MRLTGSEGRGIKVDLQWFLRHLVLSNGVSMMLTEEWRDAREVGLRCDASLSAFGCCFRCPDGSIEWFGGRWDTYLPGIDTSQATGDWHIGELECLAYCLGAHRWREQLSGKVRGRCDNESCCTVLENGFNCRDPGLLVCLRELYSVQALHGFELRARHIASEDNVEADAISRGDLERFFAYVREALGVESADIREVEPSLSPTSMLKRMLAAKSHRAALLAARAANPPPPPRRSRRRRRHG